MHYLMCHPFSIRGEENLYPSLIHPIYVEAASKRAPPSPRQVPPERSGVSCWGVRFSRSQLLWQQGEKKGFSSLVSLGSSQNIS